MEGVWSGEVGDGMYRLVLLDVVVEPLNTLGDEEGEVDRLFAMVVLLELVGNEQGVGDEVDLVCRAGARKMRVSMSL